MLSEYILFSLPPNTCDFLTVSLEFTHHDSACDGLCGCTSIHFSESTTTVGSHDTPVKYISPTML
jgi:hypothetical protein